jgi:hypothetical protein
MAEKVEVARSGGRGMIAALRRSGESPLVRALLRNRFTVEGDVVFMGIAGREPESLESIAGDPLWGCRASVRAAVARNRRAPITLAIRLLSGIPLADLREICSERWRPAAFRDAARATLAYRTETGSGITLPA